MDALRTPDFRFEKLAGYRSHRIPSKWRPTTPGRCDALRQRGSADGPPVVLLHGEPTWSYLYGTMIPPLAQAVLRACARPCRLRSLRQAHAVELHLLAPCRMGDVVVRQP